MDAEPCVVSRGLQSPLWKMLKGSLPDSEHEMSSSSDAGTDVAVFARSAISKSSGGRI